MATVIGKGYDFRDWYTGPGVNSGPSGSGDVGYAPPSQGQSGNSYAPGSNPGATASGTDLSGLLQNIMSQAATTGTNYSQMVQDLFDYSEQNSAFNAAEAEKARDWSAEQNALAMQHSASEADKTRNWQEQMSNTSNQRAVKDLVAAGLNPVLAAGSGGASTPAGSTGQGYTSGASSASADNSASAIGGLFSSVLNSAAQMSMQDKTIAWNREQLEASKAMAQLQAQTQLATSQNALTASQISANAQMAAAGTSAAAQRYHADRTYAAQKYISDQNAELTRTQQDLQHSYNYDRMAQDKQIAYDTSLVGALTNFLNGLSTGGYGNEGSSIFDTGRFLGAYVNNFGNWIRGK